jgi:hypothetical protein
MFNFTRHVGNAVQPLMHQMLDLDPSERGAWLTELRADCPTVARELERLMGPALETALSGDAATPVRDIVPGSPEHLGLHY